MTIIPEGCKDPNYRVSEPKWHSNYSLGPESPMFSSLDPEELLLISLANSVMKVFSLGLGVTTMIVSTITSKTITTIIITITAVITAFATLILLIPITTFPSICCIRVLGLLGQRAHTGLSLQA